MTEFIVEFGEFLSDEPDYQKALQHLKRSISALCRKDRGVETFYIGKGSGVEPIKAIYRRYKDKKTENMFNEDWAIYESTCVHTVNKLEKELNAYFMKKHPDRCKNQGLGSAGRPSLQPKHYIYLALRRI